MSTRVQQLQRVLVLTTIVTWLAFQSLAQEVIPSLDGPFFVPDSPNNTSPFGDEPTPDNEPKESPRLDLPAKNAGVLNNLYSHQWVHTGVDQRLNGKVVSLVGQDTLTVSGTRVMLAQNGRVMATAKSDSDGTFSFENVSPGFYSIVADADNSFAALGLAVMSHEDGSHLPDSVELRVIRPKSEDIRRILRADTIPSHGFMTDDRIVRDQIASKRIFAKSHRVMSTKDGQVLGHLSRLAMDPEVVDMSQMKVMLLKDGREIARSEVTKAGAFHFDRVTPGCYGFVAAGNQGIAAVAFCVVKPDSFARRKTIDGKLLVAVLQEPAVSELNVELADTADVMSVQESLKPESIDEEEVASEELPLPQPMIPFGGSNMFGAGQVINGGGSPYSGAIGDLIGLGAVGAIAWVIADSYGDDDNATTVVSPIVR